MQRSRSIWIFFGILVAIFSSSNLFAQISIREETIDTTLFHKANHILYSPIATGAITVDTSIDLSSYLPPVGDQGGQNSCVSWAVGYYYKTAQEAKERGWSVSLPEHQFSPRFLYNQNNGGIDQGSGMSSAFTVLLRMGCASLNTCPYNQIDFTSWPSDTAYLEAMQYRGDSLFYLPQDYSDNGVNALRQLLLDGEMATMGMAIDGSFYLINSENPFYSVAGLDESYSGDHAITVVGFDDFITTPDGVGAFKCVNSWGTSWGDSGFFFYTYELFKSDKVYHSSLYYAKDKIEYIPQLTLLTTLSHQISGTVFLSVDLRDTLSPLLTEEWNRGIIYFSPAKTARSFPDHDLVIDITEFTPYIDTLGQTVFFKVEDSYKDLETGTVSKMRVTFLDGSATFSSSDTPKTIPDSGMVSLGVEVKKIETDVTENIQEVSFTPILKRNYPNPMRSVTIIEYELPRRADVSLKLYNLLGQEVMSLVKGRKEAGTHAVKFSRTNLSSGIYFYYLEMGNFKTVKRMVILK